MTTLSEETKKVGYALIERELKKIPNDNVKRDRHASISRK